MSKCLTLILFLTILCGFAWAQVSGTPHDLSIATAGTNTYYSNQDQVCIFCHTPHHSNTAMQPLWNRDAPSTTFQVYSSPTMNAFDPNGVIPNVSGSSLLCLSCHDGVTALNALRYSFHGQPLMTGGNVITGSANLNGPGGLTNDHPVSINYATAAAADVDLVPVGSLPNWALEAGNMMQCSSCHDVHNYGNTIGMQPFLNATKVGSALCLTCHIK